MRLHRRRPLKVTLVAVATLALLASACGGDDDDATPTTKRSTTTTEATTTTPTTPPPPPPVSPLTGLLADPTTLARPALAVKIDNVARAHPQVGINQADLVYEELVEGSISRLMAIFQSTDAAPIGPVRSARSTDVQLFSPLNRPLFAWSGSNAGHAELIHSSNIVDVGHTPAEDQYFRDRSRAAPHNLFINGYFFMLDAHQADAGSPPALFSYRAATDPLGAGARPIGAVNIVFGTGAGSAPVDYAWDAAVGGFLRFQQGVPHLDSAGVQVAPPNVIIQFINYGSDDGLPVGEVVGQGTAWVLTNGQIIEGTWVKPAPEAVTQYLDAAGAPIKLTPGRTWVALPPVGGATITA